MNGSVVRATAEDGVELQGLNFRSENNQSSTVIVHLHGTGGNFYRNPFTEHFADAYPKIGYSFMTVNLRNHDDGSINEKFEDSTRDIDCWMSRAFDLGYQQIILQGHSLGALKAVYYLSRKPSKEVPKVILLSPFDIIAFYSSMHPENRTSLVTSVRQIAEKDPSALVPKELWSTWAISAGTFLNLVDQQTSADIFPFRVSRNMFSDIIRI